MSRPFGKRAGAKKQMIEQSMPKLVTVEDELRDSTQGEFRRARHRGHELSYLLSVLAEAVPDALEGTNDAEALAGRLHAIVHTVASTLTDLAEIAGRLQVIAGTLTHFE